MTGTASFVPLCVDLAIALTSPPPRAPPSPLAAAPRAERVVRQGRGAALRRGGARRHEGGAARRVGRQATSGSAHNEPVLGTRCLEEFVRSPRAARREGQHCWQQVHRGMAWAAADGCRSYTLTV